MLTHRSCSVRGVDTHVAEAGAGADVVLLHGNPDTHAVWLPVVERLSASHHTVLPDMPGFGRSKCPPDFEFSLANQAAWVRDLLDALSLSRVHLVVHDVGGTYGLAFATEHPERLRSLTIFNANFFSDYRWHFWGRVWRTRVLGELAMSISNRPLFERELRRASPRMPRAYARAAYDEFHAGAKRTVLRYYRAMDSEVYVGWDQRLLASTANLPKQVLWGDLDPFMPATTADRFGAPVRRFADCGHWVMLEEPEAAADAIARLIAEAG